MLYATRELGLTEPGCQQGRWRRTHSHCNHYADGGHMHTRLPLLRCEDLKGAAAFRPR